jgi:ABC-type multidrug transport system fused ATPase/permease subunit
MSTKRPRARDPIRDIPQYLKTFRFFIGARFYLVFTLAVLAAFAEGLGIVMLLPLLQSLDGLGTDAPTGLGAWLAGALEWLGFGGSTLAILLFITGFFLLKGAFLFLAHGYSAYLQGQLLRELKTRLFDHYSRMRLQHYVSRDTGHFVNVINGQVGGFLKAFTAIIGLGKDLIMVLVYFGVALVVAWRFGAMAIVAGIVLFAAFRQLNIYIRNLSRAHSIEAGVLSKLLIQSLQSFKYLASTGRVESVRSGALTSIKRLSRQAVRMGLAQAFTRSLREPIAVISILFILMVQMLWLQQPLAPILVSILLFYRGLNGVLALQGHWQAALSAMGSVEMVRDEFAILRKERERDGTREIGPLTHGIELRDVRFAYHENQGDVLAGVSLTIPARTSVALVGESGSGKSTLVDLVTLMLKPQSGRVLIDGVPGETIRLDTWRRQIGFVSQETVVFDDTIANNICLWQGNIDEDPFLLERVREAARQAHIAHVIEALPEGYLFVYILGVSAFFHDSAAALLEDGEIIAAAQEERFTRKKGDARFPKDAIAYCLAHAGIGPSALDQVLYYEKPFVKFERILETYLSAPASGLASFQHAFPSWAGYKLDLPAHIRSQLEGYPGPLLMADHHESHAASAFFPSPFSDAAILTIDAVGEWSTSSMGFGEGNRIELLKELTFPNSVGMLYSAFTYYCGFKVNSGEYKLMGWHLMATQNTSI